MYKCRLKNVPLRVQSSGLLKPEGRRVSLAGLQAPCSAERAHAKGIELQQPVIEAWLLQMTYLFFVGSSNLHRTFSSLLLYMYVPRRGCPCVTNALNLPMSISSVFHGDSGGTSSADVYRCASAAPRLHSNADISI